MSVDFGWRRFNFFDKNIVLDPSNADNKFLGLKDVSVDCWCSEGDLTYLGEGRGGVFRLSKQLEECYWKAYQHSLADLHFAHHYLFSVGEDDDVSGSILKIWEPTAVGEPTLKRSYRLTQIVGPNCVQATSVAVHSHLSDIVIGFSDGSVFLYQGDILKDKATRWIKVREVSLLEGSISGLALARLPGDKLVVFTITTKTLYYYIVENKVVSKGIKHSATGANRDCWTFDERLGQLILASQDMVYLVYAEQCTTEDVGTGRCYQLGRGHEKLQIVSIGEHIVLLTKQQALIPSSETEFMSMVTVYDPKGQYIAFSCSLPSLCRIFSISDSLMILSKDGTLSVLVERNLNAKLDILFKKNLYDVAVGLAKHNKDGHQYLKLIHSKYGDYLYGKGDFDNAINQYKETIGMIQPSYVIKKFHDDTRLRQLCVYLNALHESGYANGHHTAILLQCYARLKEEEKLDMFINHISADTDCDMQVAFQVLRNCGMSEKAGKLATKLKRHDIAIAIFIEDLGKYRLAISYLANLPPEEVVTYIEKFGKTLYEKCPREIMALLLRILETSTAAEVDPAQLLLVFVGDSYKSADFIEYALSKVSGDQRKNLLDTILEIRFRSYACQEITDEECQKMIISYIEKPISTRVFHMAQLFDCVPVVEFILIENGRDKELLQYYMKHNKLDKIIKLCREKSDKDFWLETLVFVSKMENIENERSIHDLLAGIEEAKCIHPLVVVDILSRSACLKVSAVKDYIVNWLEQQQKQIHNDKQAIDNGEKRMSEIEETVDSIKFDTQVVQVVRCCACDTALQLPAVHFLCKHSYHVHCFESYSDRADRCPACIPSATSSSSAQTSRENLNDRQSYMKFQSELNSAVNCMDLISKYVKLGMFDNTKLLNKKTGSNLSSKQTSTNPFGDSENRTTDSEVNSFDFSTADRKRQNVNQSFQSNSRSHYDDEKNPFMKPTTTNPFDEE